MLLQEQVLMVRQNTSTSKTQTCSAEARNCTGEKSALDASGTDQDMTTWMALILRGLRNDNSHANVIRQRDFAQFISSTEGEQCRVVHDIVKSVTHDAAA